MPESTTINNLVIGDVISFNTYGSVVPNVLNGTFLGTEAGVALRTPTVAAVNHATVYSALPSTPPTPNNYTQYNYLYIKLSNGTTVEVGTPWIISASLTRLLRSTLTLVISDIDPSQLPSIENMLNANGYINYTTSLSTS